MNLTDCAEKQPVKQDGFGAIAYAAVGILVGVALMAGVQSCDKPAIAVKADCAGCHNKYTAYFQKNGSKSPEEMAYGVLNTRNPRLLSAMAVVESNGNPSARNGGYKKRHHGAFQVNPKHHGIVPRDAASQALQAEAILTELTQTMPIEKALAAYGGDSTDKYSRRVLSELVRVP